MSINPALPKGRNRRCQDYEFRLSGLTLNSGYTTVHLGGLDYVILSGRAKPKNDGRNYMHVKKLEKEELSKGGKLPVTINVGTEAIPRLVSIDVSVEALHMSNAPTHIMRTLADVRVRHGVDAASALAAQQLRSIAATYRFHDLDIEPTTTEYDNVTRGRITAADQYLPSGYRAALFRLEKYSVVLAALEGVRRSQEYGDSTKGKVTAKFFLKDSALTSKSVYERSLDAAAIAFANQGSFTTIREWVSTLDDGTLTPAQYMTLVFTADQGPIVNLTPHAVTVRTAEGAAQREYPSQGIIRARQTDTAAGSLNGIPLVRSAFGEPTGLPETLEPNTRYIVSALAAQAIADSGMDISQFLLTSKPVLDDIRQIMGCQHFATPPQASSHLDKHTSPIEYIEAQIINLTPRDVAIYLPADPKSSEEDGSSSLPQLHITIPVGGAQALAQQNDTPVGSVHDITLNAVEFGEVTNLPDPEEGKYLIVSNITVKAAAAAERPTDDLILTSGLVRDPDGKPIGCTQLARA